MTNQPKQFHGSDLEAVSNVFAIEKTRIIPFAANVNPLGLSDTVKKVLRNHIDCISSYPDRDYKELKEAIAGYTGAELSHIYVGNGSSELIRLCIEYVSPKKAMVISPAYAEYERCVKMHGGEVVDYMLTEDQEFKLDVSEFLTHLDDSIDMLIICNPNNPTSTAIKAADLETILDTCKVLNIFVMVDETYVEFHPDMEHITAVPFVSDYDNLCVIRGVSKFFAAPGLRLGYTICSNEVFYGVLNSIETPWNVNSFAIEAGKVMFTDEAYITETKNLIHIEQSLVYSALKSRKTIKVFKPEANFILVKLLKEGQTARQVFEYCMETGFMIRDCTDYKGLGEKYIRFCFMNPNEDDKVVNRILEIV